MVGHRDELGDQDRLVSLSRSERTYVAIERRLLSLMGGGGPAAAIDRHTRGWARTFFPMGKNVAVAPVRRLRQDPRTGVYYPVD